MMGSRIGTGGSTGVNYLDSTSSYRIFKDLSHIRGIERALADLTFTMNSEGKLIKK
jgi:hypothetical protein